MTKKPKLKWRLADKPTAQEVRELHAAGLITQEEAREILFNLETEETRTVASLQQEIKFLRDLVEKLSTNRSVIIEHIKEIEKPYYKQPWYDPYIVWSTAGSGASNAVYTLNATAGAQTLDAINTASQDKSFSAIQTF